MKKFLLIFMLISMSQVANAGCWYSGHTYPTGTKIAGLTCQKDGTWK